MVLLPCSACCVTPCQEIAWQLWNATAVEMDFTVTGYDRTRTGSVGLQCDGTINPCGYAVGHDFASREVVRAADFTGTYSLARTARSNGSTDAFVSFEYSFSQGVKLAVECYMTKSPGSVAYGNLSLGSLRAGGNVAGIIEWDRSTSTISAPTSYSDTGTIPGCNCSDADASPVTRRKFIPFVSAWSDFSTISFFEARGVLFTCGSSFSLSGVSASGTAAGYSDRLQTTFPLAGSGGIRTAGFDDEPDTAPTATIEFSNLVIP